MCLCPVEQTGGYLWRQRGAGLNPTRGGGESKGTGWPGRVDAMYLNRARAPTRPEHLRWAGLWLALPTLNLVKQLMASPKTKPLGPYLWVHLRLTRMHAGGQGSNRRGLLAGKGTLSIHWQKTTRMLTLEMRNPRAPSGGWRLDLPCWGPGCQPLRCQRGASPTHQP